MQRFQKYENFGQIKISSAVIFLRSFKIWLVSKISQNSKPIKQTKINDVLYCFWHMGNWENRSIFQHNMTISIFSDWQELILFISWWKMDRFSQFLFFRFVFAQILKELQNIINFCSFWVLLIFSYKSDFETLRKNYSCWRLFLAKILTFLRFLQETEQAESFLFISIIFDAHY